jgi:hypothetical protein
MSETYVAIAFLWNQSRLQLSQRQKSKKLVIEILWFAKDMVHVLKCLKYECAHMALDLGHLMHQKLI